MTEDRDRQDARLDLHALDAAHDPARSEAVMRAVLERITTNTPHPEWWTWMARAQRGLAAAAAVLLLLAGAVLFAEPDRAGTELTELIESWATSSHVPTNGELLTAYKGYRR